MFAATLERTGLGVVLFRDNFHVIVSHYICIVFFIVFWQQCASMDIHLMK